MAGERARELPLQAVHRLVKNVTFANMGSTVVVGSVPPCIITEIKTVKKTDFNSGTTATIIVGIDYGDTTSSSTAALVSSASLASGVAQGPTTHTFVDNALSIISVASDITATLAETGTAATAGEAYIVVDYQPLSQAS